jgi:hypothetical protein
MKCVCFFFPPPLFSLLLFDLSLVLRIQQIWHCIIDWGYKKTLPENGLRCKLHMRAPASHLQPAVIQL